MSVSTHYFSYKSGTSVVTAPIVNVFGPTDGALNGNGWQAAYNGAPPSTILNETLTVTSPGYDSTGAAANDIRDILITRRIRVAGSTSLTETDVGLSRVVVAGATASGVINNSTRTSPLPVANWATIFNDVIDNSARTVEIVAAHYYGKNDGRPVACVIVSASDGTNTVYQTVSTCTVSTGGTAAGKVYVYAATFTAAQMASLNEGLITYNARVFPWIGDNTAATDIARSIANTKDWSANGQNQSYGFSPRFDVKDLTRFGTRPRCYIDATLGNNTTGRWSTDDATARSLPFLNIAGAINRSASDVVAGSSALLTAGSMDGCYVFLEAGTQVGNLSASPAKTVKAAALIVTRASGVSKAAAIMDIGSTLGCRLRLGNYTTGLTGSALRFSDVSVTRSASTQMFSDYGVLSIQFENCTFNNNGINANIIASVTSNWIAMYGGTTITGMTGAFNMLRQPRYYRNVNITGSISVNIETATMLGLRISDVNIIYVPNNGVVMGNAFAAVSANTSPGILPTATSNVSQIIYCGNVIEACYAGADYPMQRISGDGSGQSTSHVLEWHNTYAGTGNIGRHNNQYVDVSSPTTSRDRTHQWGSMLNNILVSYNTKHDKFGTPDALRIGGWEVAFGVAHDGNLIQYIDAGGGTFAPDYEGPLSVVGTSNTVPIDPLFVAPAAATPGPVAGAGGGDYSLQPGSPAKNLTAGPLFPGLGNTAGAHS